MCRYNRPNYDILEINRSCSQNRKCSGQLAQLRLITLFRCLMSFSPCRQQRNQTVEVIYADHPSQWQLHRLSKQTRWKTSIIHKSISLERCHWTIDLFLHHSREQQARKITTYRHFCEVHLNVRMDNWISLRVSYVAVWFGCIRKADVLVW